MILTKEQYEKDQARLLELKDRLASASARLLELKERLWVRYPIETFPLGELNETEERVNSIECEIKDISADIQGYENLKALITEIIDERLKEKIKVHGKRQGQQSIS